MKSDSEIANEAHLLPISSVAFGLGLTDDQYEPYGRYIAKIHQDVINEERVGKSKLILVTSISPTKAGIGKTTVSVGLSMGLNKIGKRAIVVLREPSLGPCFGMKGGACGGGYAQVLPMDKINLHFTGDFHAITSAHNMITALMDNYIYQNKIAMKQILWKRVIDINDRNLREIIAGIGPSSNGGLHNSGFDITPASEVMAIFCLARNMQDLRDRLDNILLGYKEDGSELLLCELGVTGSIIALLHDAMSPNLVQTISGSAAIIHGGPFANIAHGCNSLIATKVGLSLADYVVTEAGFGSDLGAEKFYDIKCRELGKKPSLTVLATTIRGLRNQMKEPTDNLDEGLKHLGKHVANIQGFGQPVVVVINRYADDVDSDIAQVQNYCDKQGVASVVNTAFYDGADGATAMAELVVNEIAKKEATLHYAYDDNDPLETKVKKIVQTVYGGKEVIYSAIAKKKLDQLQQNEPYNHYPVCIAKTQYSFTDDPNQTGTPGGFDFHVRDVILNRGARFIVIIAGEVLRMPGLPKVPMATKIDVDAQGRIQGLS